MNRVMAQVKRFALNEINKINLKMQIRKILLPIIFGLFLSITNASEVSFGYEIGQTSLDQVVQDLKAKNVQYEMTEENCENDSDKCARRITINDSEYFGYIVQKILTFDNKNNLKVIQVNTRDNHFPRDPNSVYMKISEKISNVLHREGIKFESKLNYLIKFSEGQRKGTFLRTFCDFDKEKDKNFLCVSVVSWEPHTALTLFAIKAGTVDVRTYMWVESAEDWEAK